MACLRRETVEEGENPKVTDKVTGRTLCSLFWEEGGGPDLVKGLGLYSEPVGIVLFLALKKKQQHHFPKYFFLFTKHLLLVRPSMIDYGIKSMSPFFTFKSSPHY